MKRILSLIPVLTLVPALALAQTTGPGNSGTIPNSHASDTAKVKVAAAMARRATHVRGEAVGLDNRPVTAATPAVRATRATPAVPNPDGGPATRAVPATPATPAVPASPSGKPADPGSQGAGHSRRP